MYGLQMEHTRGHYKSFKHHTFKLNFKVDIYMHGAHWDVVRAPQYCIRTSRGTEQWSFIVSQSSSNVSSHVDPLKQKTEHRSSSRWCVAPRWWSIQTMKCYVVHAAISFLKNEIVYNWEIRSHTYPQHSVRYTFKGSFKIAPKAT